MPDDGCTFPHCKCPDPCDVIMSESAAKLVQRFNRAVAAADLPVQGEPGA